MPKYLLKGDINGIQNFIYNVYEGEGGVAKILRARSFYISILPDVIIRYIEDTMKEKWQCEKMLNGGGGFILKVTTDQDENEFRGEIESLRKEIEGFLLENLQGEIGITFGYVEEKEGKSDFSRLNERIDAEKKKKFRTVLGDEKSPLRKNGSVFLLEDPKSEKSKKCVVCRTFFEKDDTVCDFCKKLRKLGTILPGKLEKRIKREQPKDFTFQFEIGKEKFFLSLEGDKTNKSKLHLITVPLLKRNLSYEDIDNYQLSEDIENLRRGSVAPFEVIALYSKGDKKLGYLIMDVDNLGLLFGKIDGLELKEKVSKKIDNFFSETVPRIARDEFKPDENSSIDLLEETEIYILYAGGDDLFAIGPLDRLLYFAVRVNEEFRKFAKSFEKDKEIVELLKKEERRDGIIFYSEDEEERKGLSLSAGFTAVKPKFTVRVAAKMCQNEEKRAKNGGKDAIGVFGDVLEWKTIENLIKECQEKWIPYVENKIPRRFFYRFYKLYREMMDGKSKNMMFYPLMHYVVARTIKDETVRREIVELVNNVEIREGIKFLCNYILMATRGR